ncbi:hypothetical protein EHQ43_16460 [Leptospira bouyouniensis]|uniref:DUF4386 domain-containing protein n=1 Tax=Leptospira bouyouniensis TaxID=2484911 RepID=A0A7I0HNU7_9LEPT|nr:hypothetical protein [Leptospira bouyouniensis]TGL03365.1 hypothetical protein EHQ43_16460 [Leptospira bouyouniensis]
MNEIVNKSYTLKGLPFFIASLLFAIYYSLLYIVPPPPSETSHLHLWIMEWKFYLQIADEILIFATISLLPAIYTLTNVRLIIESKLSLFASGLFYLFIIPLFVLVDLLLGRLVYPVNVYPLTADTIVFILSFITGIMHMISIMLALAILLYGVSYRKNTLGSLILVTAILGFGFQMIASYPWLLTPGILLVCQLSFPIWLFLIGLYLIKVEYRIPNKNQTDLN